MKLEKMYTITYIVNIYISYTELFVNSRFLYGFLCVLYKSNKRVLRCFLQFGRVSF